MSSAGKPPLLPEQLRLATSAPALGPCVLGDTDNAVYIGLLAVAESRDGRLCKAPSYSKDDFTNLIESVFERQALVARGEQAGVPKRQQPAARAQRNRDANSRYKDLEGKIESAGLDPSRYLTAPRETRQYHLNDDVPVDVVLAADALRDLESRFKAARILSRETIQELLRAIDLALIVLEQAFVGVSAAPSWDDEAARGWDQPRRRPPRFPQPRRWLQHVAGALEATYVRALRLKLELHDRLQFEAEHRQAIWDLSETFSATGLVVDAMDAELRAVASERELETLFPSVKALLKKLSEPEEASKLSQRVRAVQSRLRDRYAGHDLEGAAHWVGREELLAALETFWREGSGGIFALIGLGGGGKTALVRQALSRNGWLPPPESSLPRPPYPSDAPDGIFVWSFYHPVNFFDMTERATPFFEQFLSQRAREALGSREGGDRLVEILRHASRENRLLFVLDGLETQQFQEPTGRRGEFKDVHMARFLRELAATSVTVFATSRVSLESLAPNSYEQRDPSRMDPDDAAELFRVNGVGDSDAARKQLAHRLDYHVLTMYIVARLIARHHHGDANALALLPELPQTHGEPGLERAVRRLDSVLAQVDEHLDPLELILLGIVGSLAIPIPRDLLDEILISFTEAAGRDEPKIPQVIAALHRLEDRGLMFAISGADGTEFLSSHILVRHYYAQVLPTADRASIREAAASSLAAAADALDPEGPLRLQFVIERLRQLALLGRSEEAVTIYRDLLGGYRGLGWQRGDHATGMELMTMLIEAAGPRADFRLHMDLALYTKNLGLLDESAHILRRLGKSAPEERRLDAFQNLAGIYLLRGRLDEAWNAAHRATEATDASGDVSGRREAYTRLADVAARLGEVDTALEAHQVVTDAFELGSKFLQVPGHPVAWLYIRQWRGEEAAQALAYAQAALDAVEDTAGAYGMLRARQHALRARLALLDNDLGTARCSSRHLNDWVRDGTARDHEMIAAAALVSGLVAEATGDETAAVAAYSRARDIAAECGLGLYWIDALLRLASLAARHSAEEALSLAERALTGQPAAIGGYVLLGAAASDRGYRWGVLEARRLRAHLLPTESEREHEARQVADLESLLGVQVEEPEL